MIVYIVYQIKKKPVMDEATDKAKVAFNSTIATDTIKVPKSTCGDESHKFPDNLEQATDTSTYQNDPQPNPAYRMSQSTDEIYYEIVI